MLINVRKRRQRSNIKCLRLIVLIRQSLSNGMFELKRKYHNAMRSDQKHPRWRWKGKLLVNMYILIVQYVWSQSKNQKVFLVLTLSVKHVCNPI